MRLARSVLLPALIAGPLLVAAGGCKFLAKQLVDYTEYWPSGLPKSRGQMFGEMQSGEWTLSYDSGRPLAKGTYKDDRQVGEWTFYHESGNVMRAGSYSDAGLREGEWLYNYEDQTPQSRGSYVGDFEDGPWTFWFENGSVSMAGQYDSGKQSGLWRYFHPDGGPKAEGLYHNGSRVGPWQVWDESGRSRVQDFGKKAGVTLVREVFEGTDDVRRTGVLVSGKPQGRWSLFHANGKLRFCTGMAKGVATGVFESRGESGDVLAQGRFDGGKLVGQGIAVDDGVTRELKAGSLPQAPKPAADGELPSGELVAEQRLASYVAAVAAPTGAQAFAAIALEDGVELATAAKPAPLVEQVVQQLDEQPARMPAPAQPQLTVKQKKDMERYIAEYTDGPKRAGGGMFSDYAPASNSPRPKKGTGRRPNLEGKPLPFDKMLAVDGGEVDLTSFRGKQQVMVVVLRGFLGEVCCYCVAQTKALARARSKLEKANVKVLVIYPGQKENESSFRRLYEEEFGEGPPPYRVFYDPNLELVTKLGIEGDLASPTTLILDKQGIVQYAYVGEHRADRPATNKLIELIEGFAK
ncbi:MAG: redoxin family protein [Planctomycetota bacterium]